VENSISPLTDFERRYSGLFHLLPNSPVRQGGHRRLESQAERRCTVSKKHTETPEPATQSTSIIQPIIDDLKGATSTEPPKEDLVAPPRGPLHPPQPAELDQDPGGGYNPDGTYPQT
jgi:hypothetical protein